MGNNIQKQLALLATKKKRKSFRKKIVMVLASVVVFCTTYALILPAITQDTGTSQPLHTHDAACYKQVCICSLSEEPHIHDDTCYEMRFVDAVTKLLPMCQEPEPHEHTENCFVEEFIEAHEEQVLTCTLSETAHVHSGTCYVNELICGFGEINSNEPVSNPTADVETMLHWQEMFKDYPYTGNLREDLVGIAKTQVGYCESTQNFVIGYDGIRRGYTRYGARYDAPYKEWSAMFVSFCLQYAGADPEELPGETEAKAMLELWETLGRYIPAETYIPAPGDLVFFEDETVGIVTDVQNANVYFICGDMENTVQSTELLLADERIIGWGSTEGATSLKEVLIPTANPSEEVDILDISNGPAVFIFGGEGMLQAPRMQTFSLRMSRSVTDLLAYLEANNGTYFFTLLDFDNHELPKDANGNYVVQADTGYKLTVSFTSPEGFAPGTYQYQVPNGLLVDGGEGTFILKDGTNVGNWTVTDEGLITLYFNENMNSRTEITISATLGIHFPAQDDPIDFDGKVTVTVEKPNQDLPLATMLKWGSQGDEANGQDPTKIYWTALITGNTGTQVPGNTITDKVLVDQYLGEHHYTQSDMDAGLSIGISELATGNWHSWVVYPGDPNLTWEEDTWSYTMPEVGNCMWCGPLTLGNEGFEYYIQYTSTPKTTVVSGARDYMNHVTVDNVAADGWARFTQGEIHADITKTGTFMGDAAGGAFVWEFQAMIPGIREGQKADYFWYIMDYMSIRSADGNQLAYIHNDSNNSTVTATYNGTVIQVPTVEEATDADPYAWHNYWSPDHNGIYYGRQLILLSRCNCTADTCQFWNGTKCTSDFWFVSEAEGWHPSGYCHCWTAQENTLFTFHYKTEDLNTVEAYGGMNNNVRNDAELYNMIVTPDGTIGTKIDTATDSVPIPELFNKVLTHDFDGYTANYKITLNESKLVLTDGSPLTIRDEMTETLAFISGSLVITAEDANGIVTTLRQGVDYTTEYDGTGNEHGDNGKPTHVLTIVINNPQPVKYTLDYDATLIIPPGTTQAIKYNNSAKVTLWGEDITDSSNEKVYAEINIAAKNYKVQLFKTSSTTGKPLGGATFGLYNEHGGLITSGVTDANGELLFQTDIINGIILREHILYYMQELKAPAGYMLDETKYWFCFCDKETGTCQICKEVEQSHGAASIPSEQLGKVHVANELLNYTLPATGGPGTKPYIAGGTVLFFGAAIALLYKMIRRKEDDDSP